MALNGVRASGDDQMWKAEVEKELQRLRDLVKILTAQNKGRRNG